MKRSYFLCLFLILTGLVSCRVNRPVITPSSGTASAGDYIQRYKDLAVSEMIRSGVPASITLAQGMIESDYGRSTLARTANNHFGIKCHDWEGPSVRHHDDKRNECFRKYARPEDSFTDHSDFLRNRSRYGFLFELPVTDYKGWARGLKKAGYATAPHYADMLIRKIEEYNLHYYDHMSSTAQNRPGTQSAFRTDKVVQSSAVSGRQANSSTDSVKETGAMQTASLPEGLTRELKEKKEVVPVINDNFTVQIHEQRILVNNGLQYIIVKEGETINMIEKDYGLFRWEIQRFNDLKDNFEPEAGQMLYIQPKRNKAGIGNEKHIAGSGETLHYISQKYGVRLNKLYEYNRMQTGSEITVGQEVWLRQTKPAK